MPKVLNKAHYTISEENESPSLDGDMVQTRVSLVYL